MGSGIYKIRSLDSHEIIGYRVHGVIKSIKFLFNTVPCINLVKLLVAFQKLLYKMSKN